MAFDPQFADYSAMPQFTPEMVHAYLDAEIDRVRKTGLDVDACLVAPDETAEAEVEAALNAKSYGCVVIGAGLREPPEHLLLFERILNLVHRLAPDARIAFNTTPGDTTEAVRRWLV